ncbi:MULTISPECIES: hypothetical protein [unclassified Anabaena]|uniref:hypothetical protein n=1 Tax=unclassified Anabaena TaxID=2619674 RepID=UPI00144763BF|nr:MULTISPECIES: hypothetical protein [unclassified Anabaena]MTJ07100.1 hypothetical protein [Anabaena sp. UHCC 0204]MTJ51984.1 hypothetical protein [Anabaena sp. UHCC 0253]
MRNNSNSGHTLLETVLQRIFSIRRITRQDQHLLMSTLLSKEGLDETERTQITRVFDGLRSGFIKVVD